MKKVIPFLLILATITCTSDNSADKHYAIGLKHFEKQEYLHALHNFDKALQLDENYAMAYLKRAQVHLIKDDYVAAYYDLNRFIEFDTLVSEGYTQRAILKYEVSDFYGALSDCNKAIAADNENAKAYSLRGRIKIMFENNQGAYDDLSKAIELNDKDKRPYLYRGDVNMMLANTSDACADYHLAAELGSMRAYKRIVEYCSDTKTEVKVVTVEKTVEKVVEKEAPKMTEEAAVETNPLDKWHRLADIRGDIFEVKTLAINRQIVKGEEIEWGSMGPMDKTYVLVKEKEDQIFNLMFIVEGEKTYEGFYTYTDAKENNITVYQRVDKNWDEVLISDKPFEFVLDRLQTEGRTTIEIIDYHRGVGAKVLF